MMLRRYVPAWLCLLFLGLPPPVTSADDYLDELIAAARSKKLAEHPQWRALVHYKPRLLFPGMQSEADDRDFFNAPDGKTNPQHELEATLAAFFSDRGETPTQQNPQCRFVARYHWLKQQLGFDSRRLPERACLRYEEWRAALNAEALTLVFPAAYLNSPASMYGHTLLRVDAHDQDERTRLLAYSINYAANTNETSGLIFAVKGIFGGYPGLFSVSPYYLKVKEYTDLESRDIWEYELNFTPQEIDRLLMHAWELRETSFDYYFFDENCSYHLLSLFDVARPELRLTDRFAAWAIPADTVRVLTEEPGMLRRVTYRPARSTILRHRAQRLTEKQVSLAKELALEPGLFDEHRLARLSDVDRARVLEFAYEYLEYRRLRGRTTDGDRTAVRLRELLLARSRLNVPDEIPPRTPAVRPDEGHRSARVSVRIGREDGEGFQELQWRPAYHDLLDPEEGYNRGAAIEFFGVTLRHRERDDRTRVERVDLINITSLSPRDELLKPLSWKVDVGYTRKRFAPDDEPLVFGLVGGTGFAWEKTRRLLWYGMVEGALEASGRLEHGYAFGAGIALGGLLDLSDRWRMQWEGRALRYGVGDAHSAAEVAVNQRFTVSRHGALRAELVRRREFTQRSREWGISWNYYF